MVSSSRTKDSTNKAVGYGRPPASTQFKAGQSGNHKGRPKGSLNYAALFFRALREKVTINENGRRKVVTTLEAAIMQIVNRAASGDDRAFRQLRDLIFAADERIAKNQSNNSGFSESDEKVMQGLLDRLGKSNGEEK